MLPNKNYRDIEKKYGIRGKYVFNRVVPWIGRLAFIGGVGLMIYGAVLIKMDRKIDKDKDKGIKYLGIGAGASFVSGYALQNRKKTLELKNQFEEDRKEGERIRNVIIKKRSLEGSLKD